MLSPAEKQEIEREAAHYPRRQAAVIEALKVVQKHRRWVSDEALADVAGCLDMDPAEVENVATFYNLIYRRPVGEHVILVCDSISCWVLGATAIRRHLCARLGVEPGQTTADKRFTVLPVACLGACEQAPAMMIDETLYGQLTTARVDEILARLQESAP
jgi:NADH-quinone oxidoreductase subunit E